jgi:cysteine synthase A
MKLNNILQGIGNTPHIKINNLYGEKANIWMKLERNNPGGSIKDRIALSMIEDAEEKGLLTKDSVIIEPTSGNTGVGLAMVAAVKNYKVILVMPESMSIERRRLMSAYGAQVELTPKELGSNGTIEKAKNLAEETPNSWMPMQFDNEANLNAHRKFTAKEILADFPDGLDYLITGVGTGGHITGCAEILTEKFKDLKVFAVEPELSPVISGGDPGPHPIQGIGAGFIPSILNTELLEGSIQVSKEEAFEYAARCAKEEGIFLGISSGASLAAVAKKLPDIADGAKVLTFCYDTGERYLSVPELFG